ncbi:MAG: DUF2778 domain-containing protein [Roseiarcus sp.]|jgi:type VI secretion system (T6SS) effector TldE1-like protein
MIRDSVASDVLGAFRRLSLEFLSRAAPGAAALAVGLAAGAWILHRLPVAAPMFAPTAASHVAAPVPKFAADAHGLLFDPGFAGGSARFSATGEPSEPFELPPLPPIRVAANPPPGEAGPIAPPIAAAPAQTAPAPPPRPAEFAPPAAPPAAVRRLAQNGKGAPAPAAPTDDRNFFEKLFGAGRPSGPPLAYAAAEDGVSSAPRSEAAGPSARWDRWTAVYDLSAHTVYLPDGTRLEAHSGLGNRIDDPDHVAERNRGATPPHVYALEAREQLFHGVQALRLNPIGGAGDIFGRAGLLAHSYMLGPNGDSNGCVSFRNYDAFLQAFHSGQVKRLAVVARLG